MATAAYRERLLDVCAEADNFNGPEVRPESRQLILYGVGRPGPAVLAAVAEAPPDLTVTWTECPYTVDELNRETERLMELHGETLHTGGPDSRYSGLAFSTSDDDLLGSADPAAVLRTVCPVTVRRGLPVAF
jgi:hypothetical protein